MIWVNSVLPAIGQEELWDELLDISRVVGYALPGGWDTVEHAVRHVKPARPASGNCLLPCNPLRKVFLNVALHTSQLLTRWHVHAV